MRIRGWETIHLLADVGRCKVVAVAVADGLGGLLESLVGGGVAVCNYLVACGRVDKRKCGRADIGARTMHVSKTRSGVARIQDLLGDDRY